MYFCHTVVGEKLQLICFLPVNWDRRIMHGNEVVKAASGDAHLRGLAAVLFYGRDFCGTAAALAFGGPTVQGCILGAAGSFGSGNRGVKEYITVFRQRALETCGGWLAGVTVCSQMLFGFLTFYAGMSLAVVLSVLTIRKGLLGIAAFLCTVLPHGLVYLLVWYVLSGWSGQIQKKLHILPGLLLLIITGAGAFLEVFVSPFLWGLFP